MSCRALLFLFSLFLRLAEFLDGAVGVEEAQLSSFAEVADGFVGLSAACVGYTTVEVGFGQIAVKAYGL